MKRLLFASIAVALLAALVGFGLTQTASNSPVSADDGITVDIDMDADMLGAGPCATIDTSTNVLLGGSFEVALCVSGLDSELGVVAFHVTYDDSLIAGVEEADVDAGTDDNPDFNDDEWGDGIGPGFDCSGGGAAYPMGDKIPGAGGDAFFSCTDVTTGPWTLGDDETDGVLATIEFDANPTTTGTATLTIGPGLLGDSGSSEVGSCNPDLDWPMTCNDGEVGLMLPPPQCDIADEGMEADPPVVSMKIGEHTIVHLTETIHNLGEVGPVDPAVCPVGVAWNVMKPDQTPIETDKIGVRLEALGGNPASPLDGDLCYMGDISTQTAGYGVTWWYLPCDEDSAPASPQPETAELANNTGSCQNLYDDDEDGTCNWAPYVGICTDPNTGPDPECIDVQQMSLMPLAPEILAKSQIAVYERDLKIECRKVGTYYVMVVGAHAVNYAGEFTPEMGYDPNPANDMSPVVIPVSCTGLEVAMEKDADVTTVAVDDSNTLFLMDPDLAEGYNCDEGKGCLAINVVVSNVDDIDNDNDADGDAEGLGAWEHQIKFEHKLVSLTDSNLLPIDPETGEVWIESEGRIAYCTVTILTENYVLEGCITKDDPETVPIDLGPIGDGLLEQIIVTPLTDDLIYRDGFRPTKDNGVVTDLVDENCEITDIYAEPMAGLLPGGLTWICSDAHIAIRMLEGDLDLDCDVDVVDDAAVAFRYGSFFGLLLYDQWYDLEPKYADFDIDIKDLQFVFGRNWSTCQAPIPDDQDDPVETAQP